MYVVATFWRSKWPLSSPGFTKRIDTSPRLALRKQVLGVARYIIASAQSGTHCCRTGMGLICPVTEIFILANSCLTAFNHCSSGIQVESRVTSSICHLDKKHPPSASVSCKHKLATNHGVRWQILLAPVNQSVGLDPCLSLSFVRCLHQPPWWWCCPQQNVTSVVAAASVLEFTPTMKQKPMRM